MKLTFNAIERMRSEGEGEDQALVVEVSDLKKYGTDTMKFTMKDESTITKAVLWIDDPKKDLSSVCKKVDNEERYLIRVKKFKTHIQGGKTMIEVIDFDPLDPPKTAVKPVAPPVQKTSSKPIEPLETQLSRSRIDDEPEDGGEDMNDDKLRQFEKITDLYVDFQGRWQIVARILQKNYRQFNNRQGKLTKILSLILTDRTGTKIEGVMFGDNGKEYNDLLREGAVYRIAKGQIREDSYRQNKGREFSKFNIVFSKNTQFIAVHDMACIPSNHNDMTPLNTILEKGDFETIYSLVVILLEIGQERIIDRGDREIYKKALIVGDPETRKSIEVTVWKKELNIEANWLDKTVVLKHFKLHSYKESLSLSSTFRSEIAPIREHKFSMYEGKFLTTDYQSVSNDVSPMAAERTDTKEKQQYPKTARDLESDLAYVGAGEPVISDLDVWLSQVSFKGKWFYEACSSAKCKKGAEVGTACLYCGHHNAQTVKKFILPVELSDYTGSIWVTAFDQFAQEIFPGLSIEHLSSLAEQDLREEAESRLYRQFKVRLSSKKEQEGGVKHNIMGRVTEVNVARYTSSSVDKIKAMMYGRE